MTKKLDVDYAIEIDFQKDSRQPERVFYSVLNSLKISKSLILI